LEQNDLLQIRQVQGLEDRVQEICKEGHPSCVIVYLKQTNKSAKEMIRVNLKTHMVLYFGEADKRRMRLFPNRALTWSFCFMTMLSNVFNTVWM